MTTDQAKKLSEDAIARLLATLERGQSQTLKLYLTVMSRFHRYSWLCSAQHNHDYVYSRTM